MSRPITELSEQELKTLITAAVARGIFEAQRSIDQTNDPDRESTRLAIAEVDRAVEKVINFARENKDSPVVGLPDSQALIEIEIRKLSPDALKYLAGDQFVRRVAQALNTPEIPAMSRNLRLHRVVRLCCTFAQALAYYRVQQSEDYRWLFDPAKTGSAGANFGVP